MLHESRISPALRARITRLVASGDSWNGHRRGVLFRFSLTRQPTLENHRIAYEAVYRRRRIRGVAGTVFDAIQEIECEIERRTNHP